MFLSFKKLSNQNGQALLVVVLVMVVALTVGLSIASRTIINLRSTTEQAGAQKALSAAEAGVELAIKNNLALNTPMTNTFSSIGGNTTAQTTAVSAGGGTNPFLLSGGDNISRQDAIYAWIIPYSQITSGPPWSGTQLTFYWGEGSTSCTDPTPPPAIEVAVIYQNTSATCPIGSAAKDCPALKRFAFDPCNRGNGFKILSGSELSPTTISASPSDVTLNYHTTITMAANTVLLVRINPIYSSTRMGIWGNGVSLAAQGKVITSVGTSNSSNATRKISVFEGYPEVPAAFFPFTLFQPN